MIMPLFNSVSTKVTRIGIYLRTGLTAYKHYLEWFRNQIMKVLSCPFSTLEKHHSWFLFSRTVSQLLFGRTVELMGLFVLMYAAARCCLAIMQKQR